jgi:hypothetical protein
VTRGLTAGQIANLSQQSFRSEDLVGIYFPSGVQFYTSGAIAVTVTIPNVGNTQFQPNGFLSQIGNVKESFWATPNSLDLQFSRSNTIIDSKFDSDTLINIRVFMYKLFRDTSTTQPDNTNGVIQVFDGTVSGLDIEYALDQVIYTLRCTSDFGDYDKVRGKTTADIDGALLNRKLYWGSFFLD